MIRFLMVMLTPLLLLTGCSGKPPDMEAGTKKRLAKIGAEALTYACRCFHDRYGYWPDELRDLSTMPPGEPYVAEDKLRDPWGNPYRYRAPQEREESPVVYCVSPDQETIKNGSEP